MPPKITKSEVAVDVAGAVRDQLRPSLESAREEDSMDIAMNASLGYRDIPFER